MISIAHSLLPHMLYDSLLTQSIGVLSRAQHIGVLFCFLPVSFCHMLPFAQPPATQWVCGGIPLQYVDSKLNDTSTDTDEVYIA